MFHNWVDDSPYGIPIHRQYPTRVRVSVVEYKEKVDPHFDALLVAGVAPGIVSYYSK